MFMSFKPNKAPETHPNYRPPVDMPALEFGAPAPVRQSGDDAPLPASDYRFVVADLLTPSECASVVSVAEAAGLSAVDWEYDPSYRSCRRVVLRSRPLAAAVYARLLPLLSPAACERVRPFGFDGDGDWRPCKVNEVVRVSRYDPGDKFERHRDGAFVENDDVRSVYTVLVYLNGPPAFGGGATRVFCDEEGVAVVPRTGAALVMTHDTEHAGEVVASGRKYVARFDVMFRRLGGSLTEAELARLPGRALAEGLYRSSIAKQRDGDPRGSTEDYVRALELQARLPSATVAPAPGDGEGGPPDLLSGTLDEDSFVRALRFLAPEEVARASATCRRWRRACSSSLLWREMFMLRWPSLLRGESLVLSHDEPRDGAGRLPPAIYDDPAAAVRLVRRWGRRCLHTVFVAILPDHHVAAPDSEGRERLRKELYGDGERVSQGYMYGSLRIVSDVACAARRGSGTGWKRFHASVRAGAIHFTEYSEAAEREASHRSGVFRRSRGRPYDASGDVAMIAPSPVPIEHDTDISFSFRQGAGISKSFVDSCVVKLPDKAGHLVICKNDPRIEHRNTESYWSPTFVGILEDIARVVVGRQTEAALRFGDVAVKSDAKTKQWKTAYARRHIAEKFFDIVTIDIGHRQTKFTADNVNVENILLRGDLARSESPDHIHDFFLKAILKYHLEGDEDWVPRALKSLRGVVASGQAASLVDKAMKDPEMWLEMPQSLFEACRGCGCMASLVSRSMGHLWSAGHGLQNHHVGDMCIGFDTATAPFDANGDPDCNAMAIICAHVVERTLVRRVNRRNNFIRATCAEHPVNIVEPALGYNEEVRMQLARALASYHVPFVGFVNGAGAALMCGDEPRRDGIVIALGGVNSAAVPVVGGAADTSRGIKLALFADENTLDDPYALAGEAGTAVKQLLASGGGTAADQPVPVLVTGGRASNAVVAAIRNIVGNAHVYTASREGERHLDAARGAHILANLSDGRKHFRTILHTMWSLENEGTQ